MSAQILDGKLLAQSIKDSLKKDVGAFSKNFHLSPALKAIAIGHDAAAESYVVSQKKCAQYVGVDYELINLPESVSSVQLMAKIQELNQSDEVHGIMIHQPIPEHINYMQLINILDIHKDIEGMSIGNLGKLLLGKSDIIPCTPASVVELLRSTGIDFKGKEAVVVGRSEIVGKPLSLLLLELNLTVTVCHSKTVNLEEHLKRADVVVVSIGKPGFIKGEWIKKGAIVVDVGINRVGSKIVGDVEYSSVKEVASFITPVPGGVGPLTSVMLLRNCVLTYKRQMEKGTQ